MSSLISSPPVPPSPSPGDQNGNPTRVPRRLSAVVGGFANLAVFVFLAGVLVLGHQTGWKMPRFSALRGTGDKAAVDWCTEHLVPESECVECNDEILPKPKSFGFCKKHGVAECVIDHPELAQVKGEPQLPRYDTAKAITVVARPENNSRNTLHQHRVQFASAESAVRAGIDVDVVQERRMMDSLTANGELQFNPTRVAHLTPRVVGTVAVVLKTIGDDVQAGEVLALVDAAPVGQAKSHLLQAIVQLQLKRKNAERLRSAVAAAAVPGKSLIDAEAALQEADIGFQSARQSLVNLGFDLPDDLDERNAAAVAAELRLLGLTEAQIATLPAGTKTANLIPVRAPYDGQIVDSEVVAGEFVNVTKILFTVADPRRMWLILNVRQEDARYVAPGLAVVFETDDGSQKASGRISWVSPAVEERTRTLQVRVPLDSGEGKLRDKTFGTGTIVLREEPHAIVVPKEAVQSTSDAHFIFVRDKDYLKEGAPKVFHVRQVRICARDDRFVELLAGALPGEVIATKGSPVLLAQLLRSSLGAGCGCHEH
jgi:cobalt-zinc-cadmium efflux system membrane fusion protein